MGFWHRLEERILAIQRDRARAARLLQIAYYVSTLVVVLGVVIMFLVLLGWWPF